MLDVHHDEMAESLQAKPEEAFAMALCPALKAFKAGCWK